MDQALERARAVPGIVNPTSDLLLNTPQLNVEIDRDVAGDLGIDVSTVANTLAAALGDYRVSTFSYGTRNYNVIVELDERGVSQAEGIGRIQVGRQGSDQNQNRRAQV